MRRSTRLPTEFVSLMQARKPHYAAPKTGGLSRHGRRYMVTYKIGLECGRKRRARINARCSGRHRTRRAAYGIRKLCYGELLH